MAQQSKSYRYGKPIAPYKQHVVVNNASNGSSFFKKMKSLFGREQSTKKARNQSDKASLGQGEDSLPRIPGGFFATDDSRVKVVTTAGMLQRSENSSANVTQSIYEEESNDESEIVNTSNAKLAEFFSKKGDQPLTDIEMEGVLSLMKKASRTATARKRPLIATDFDDSTTVESSRVLRSSRTPSMAATYNKAPSFTPGYEDSVGSQSLGNASLRSTSSRRRVFDYSSFPTPYKTVVYKYSAADGNRFGSTAVPSEAPSNEPGQQANSNNSSVQRLSNTASALVSLLGGKESNKDIPSLCSNPYSSYIEPIRQYKKKVSTILPRPDPAQSSSLRSEALEKIQDAKDESNSQVLPKQRQKGQQKPSSDKYKPARSSSLRSSIVPVEEVSKTVKENGEKPAVPTAARFSFSLEGMRNEKEQAEVRQPDATPLLDHAGSVNAPKPRQRMTELGVNESDSGNGQAKKSDRGESNHKEPVSQQVEDKFDSQSKIGLFPSKSLTPEPVNFDFGEPLPSNVDAGLIDGAKVEKFKSLFAF
ncbi:hypothetical protein HG536_0D04280 [Torulaspora globosa]|uniref:Nucleoporin NUP60 n=1 Tax=Torulaspora globosa TaxID=48254 RepID=A0A7G3ZHC0_9SACH|nr:uncharacterized protein HG536_0D04280 [Torulaspora globosa]QLL32906.1 hypothetical protein HG536_0D04280 [Torulaspora globosa]